MIKALIIGLTLFGSIGGGYGRIGVKVTPQGYITKIHAVSPAARTTLKVGDRIIEADGHKGHRYTDGEIGATAYLTIKRDKEILKFEIVRMSPEFIHD